MESLGLWRRGMYTAYAMYLLRMIPFLCWKRSQYFHYLPLFLKDLLDGLFKNIPLGMKTWHGSSTFHPITKD